MTAPRPDPLRVQIWSYNYDPEPQGIAPLTTVVAETLRARGHDVLVVAAHPHYPEPVWGMRIRPYRERRNGVPVLRLPLWIGRGSGMRRVRQELSFLLSQSLASPLLPTPDALVAVTPSFPALAAAMAFARVRRVPWVMWLQDIVTDGAATTGLIGPGRVLAAARRFERAAYRDAARIVVISEAFRDNLVAKGVRADAVDRIYNPTSRSAARPTDVDALLERPPRMLAMGNIGHTQGLDRIVDAFQADAELARQGAVLSIAGGGVAADAVAARIESDRVELAGVLYGPELEPALRGASLGVVSQRPDISEFNLPSKLMNYMAYGIPVIASVRPDSETARIVRESGAGWVTDARDPGEFARTAAAVIRDREALREASVAGFRFAAAEFSAGAVTDGFERVLAQVVKEHRHG